MRSLLSLLFAVLLSTSLGFAQTKQEAKPGAARVPDKALIQEIWDAWNTMDPANAAKYYDPGAAHVFFDIAPLKYDGWAAYATGAKEVLATFKALNGKVNPDVRVHVRGNLAWATSTFHMDAVSKDGKPSPLDGRWTGIFQKKGDRWLIVHEHLSVPLPSPEQK